MRIEIIVLIIALIFSIISLLISLHQKEILTDISTLISLLPQLSTENYLKVEKVEVSFEPPSITLYTNCFKLVGYVEETQAKSIFNALQNIRDWRPNTHDVTSDMFKEFNIKLIDIRIEEIKNNSYIAKTFIIQGKKIREIDIRPSDGIALALRLNAPIYIKKQLLYSVGEKIC